jgi:hypothetical protein
MTTRGLDPHPGSHTVVALDESVRIGGSPEGEDQPIGILNSCPAHELSALPIAADFSTE